MDHLTILLIGRGGRESALAYKLSQSEHVQRIYVAPGNGSTAQGLEKVENITEITEEDLEGLVRLSKKLNVNLVVPGPDVPIVKGTFPFWYVNTCQLRNETLKFILQSWYPLLCSLTGSCSVGRFKGLLERLYDAA